MLCGWEGNRRSGVTLATCHRHQWFSTYGLKAWEREMSTPYALLWTMVDFTFFDTSVYSNFTPSATSGHVDFCTEDKINDEDNDNENHY